MPHLKIPRRGTLAAAIVLIGLLGFLAPACAIDFTGRIDTRYQLQAGDNAIDNDIYNYHSLVVSFSQNFSFSWYGGVIASLNDRVNTLSTGGAEASDNALRNLQDVGNPGQYINYTIYSAYLKYDSGVFGAVLGRCNPADYNLTRFDGLMIWVAPVPWLRLEAFGGMPWHYAYVTDPARSFENWEALFQSWPDCELAAGGADFRFLDDALKVSLKYLYLREFTNSNGLISPSLPTYLSEDSLTKAFLSISPWPWLSAGAAASVLDVTPLSVRAWVSGDIEPLHLSYAADFETQFIDVTAISDRLTEFSSLLTASNPYLDASVDLTENLAEFFPRGGVLSDVEVELGYEHRQPFSPADVSMSQPPVRPVPCHHPSSRCAGGLDAAGVLFAPPHLGVENTLHVVGGELGRKWSSLDVRLGSSFNASL